MKSVFSRLTLVIFLSGILAPTFAQSNDARYKLAAFHAPIVFQETGHNPKADALTKFDFDGDHIGNNNWENLPTHPTPAFVYYDVRESKTHYFIMYSFFHPRDYSYICIPWICHENDLEGAMLTIEKSEDPMGRLVAIQTLAHDRIFTHDDFNADFEIRGPAGGSELKKVTVFIEWGGHGVYAWDPLRESKIREEKATRLYTENQIMSVVPDKYSKEWLIYQFSGHADDPKGAAQGTFGYDLLPIHEELWDRRNEISQRHTFAKLYDFVGSRFKVIGVPAAFAGERWGTGRARPPWAWTDSYYSAEHRGEWFLDPALYLTKKVKRYKKTISLDYVYNPYVLN